jgi:hypothetical protein
VTDAGAAGDGAIAEKAHQIGDPAGALANLQAALVQHSQPGTIVAAVFETVQSFEQGRFRFSFARVADNTAHGSLSSALAS